MLEGFVHSLFRTYVSFELVESAFKTYSNKCDPVHQKRFLANSRTIALVNKFSYLTGRI